MPIKYSKPRAILFDLDGTLADTAPDLASAINMVRTIRGLTPLPFPLLRQVSSEGARGLIYAAFKLVPQDEEYEGICAEFLNIYSSSLIVKSHLFAGVQDLLSALHKHDLPWGIVTNKASRFSEPIIHKIGLSRAQCIISGDTTSFQKPHPAPLIEAANRLNLPATDCWYVGDDLRDIQAGQAAGMKTVAAIWGYCGSTKPETWKADMLIDTPLQLIDFIS